MWEGESLDMPCTWTKHTHAESSQRPASHPFLSPRLAPLSQGFCNVYLAPWPSTADTSRRVFALRNSRALDDNKITHVLSAIKYSLDNLGDQNGLPRRYQHLSVDIDDVEDEDILVHLPKMVRFIERGLYGEDVFIDDPPSAPGAAVGNTDGIAPAAHATNKPPGRLSRRTTSGSEQPTGAVFVHCAMGKSRSVTTIIAYLLWKHPHRFGKADPTTTASSAVAKALKWVQKTRPMAEPNPGFMKQLEIWWEMGCPTDSDDAVETRPLYQRWLYKQEVELSARLRKAPDWLRFEDEVAGGGRTNERTGDEGRSLRCKKCRRVLATGPFIVPHQGAGEKAQACPHVFIEPLSWMRPTLEEGGLEGRLVCPNAKCGASIGRYSWQGFRCSCNEWVCPAFSLQRSKVDEMATAGQQKGPAQPGGVEAATARLAALGIRMPPPGSGAGSPGRQENL